MGFLNAGTGLIILGFSLIIFFPITNALAGDAFTAIDNANNMAFGGLGKTAISLFGFVFVIGGLFSLIRELQRPDYNPLSDRPGEY